MVAKIFYWLFGGLHIFTATLRFTATWFEAEYLLGTACLFVIGGMLVAAPKLFAPKEQPVFYATTPDTETKD